VIGSAASDEHSDPDMDNNRSREGVDASLRSIVTNNVVYGGRHHSRRAGCAGNWYYRYKVT
jgi:hypothetical protein